MGTPAEPPATVKAKIDRAKHHLQTFLDDVGQYGALDPYSIVPERNDEGTDFRFYLRIKHPLPSERWALKFGDFVHNLRSALDHMIYDCAIKASGATPPPKENVLMFPIVARPADFKRHVWRLGELRNDSAFVAGIKALQPNNRPEVYGLRPLATLQYLDVRDKHRLLNVVVAKIEQPHIIFGEGYPPPGGQHSSRVEWTIGYALEDGTQLVALTNLHPAVPADVDVKVDLRAEVSIGHAVASNDNRTVSGAEWLATLLMEEVETVIAAIGRLV